MHSVGANIEQWRNAMRANGDVLDMTALALFVEAAMDPELDGWDQDDGLAEDEFMYEGSVFQIVSPDHALLGAAATGAFSECFPKPTP
jgi:hypothetical protein